MQINLLFHLLQWSSFQIGEKKFSVHDSGPITRQPWNTLYIGLHTIAQSLKLQYVNLYR